MIVMAPFSSSNTWLLVLSIARWQVTQTMTFSSGIGIQHLEHLKAPG